MILLKTMLYVLLLGTSTSLGFVYSQKFNKRVDELNDFKSGLYFFKTKIRFTYEPIQEIFCEISKSIKSNAKDVFYKSCKNMQLDDATKSWNKAISETELSLTLEDKKALLTLGKLLGKTDAKGQISEIDLCLNFLDDQIKKAEEEKKKNSKLYKTLGTVLGIGMIIILL